MSTITNLENIDPETAIDVKLTAKELLYLREFIGFMLPDYIADTQEIYRQAGMDTRVIPVTTEEYGLSKAKRPFNSRLDKSKLLAAGFRPLPDWKDALARYLVEIGEA